MDAIRVSQMAMFTHVLISFIILIYCCMSIGYDASSFREYVSFPPNWPSCSYDDGDYLCHLPWMRFTSLLFFFYWVYVYVCMCAYSWVEMTIFGHTSEIFRLSASVACFSCSEKLIEFPVVPRVPTVWYVLRGNGCPVHLSLMSIIRARHSQQWMLNANDLIGNVRVFFFNSIYYACFWLIMYVR